MLTLIIGANTASKGTKRTTHWEGSTHIVRNDRISAAFTASYKPDLQKITKCGTDTTKLPNTTVTGKAYFPDLSSNLQSMPKGTTKTTNVRINSGKHR